MNKKTLYTDKEVRIFADPYRSRIMEVFFIHKGKSFTSKQIADMMGEAPSKVNYHIKKLVSIDVLHIDHTEKINGITASFYILPYDAIVLDKESVTNSLFRKSAKNFRFANYHIHKGRFENHLDIGLQLADEDPEKDKFHFESTNFKLYIKEEEFQEVSKRMFDVLRPYMEPKENTNEYNVLMANIKTKSQPDEE